tara:strand:+ start:1660 stop:4338 length:2679 start_codon:yes stop_codon:yes gene_type:complete
MAIEFLNSVDFNQNQIVAPAIESLATAPGAPVEGQMYFDSTGGDKTMYYWNGSAWKSMDGSAGTMSDWKLRDDDGDDKTVSDGLFVKFVAATGTLGTNVTGTGTTGDPFVMTITSPDTDTTYSVATASALGLVKLEDDTEQSVAANAVSATASRTYGIQLNSSEQAVVNVPWTDTDTTYSAMTSSALGLGKLEDDTTQTTAANAVTTTASRTYGIQFNSSNQLVVNVPWTDTDTTYSVATSSALGLIKLEDDTTQTTAANAVTTTASRTYGLQLNSSNQGVINVPWTDTDTNYTYALSVGAVSSNESTLSLTGGGGGSTTTAKFSGTTDEIEITTPATGDGGDITIGLPAEVTITTSLDIDGSAVDALKMTSGKAQTAATTAGDADATLTTKGYVDGLVTGGLQFKGTFRADTGLILGGGSTYIYQLTGSAFDPSATRVAVEVGDYYVCATAGGDFYGDGGTGTCSPTRPITVGDSIIGVTAASATASTCANWSIVESNEGVTTFTNANGTYVSASTVNTGATGAVTVGTIDLSAVDGTSTTGTRFLSKDNTWDVPSYTTDTTYSAATSSALGLMKLASDTQQDTAAESVTATANRTYGIQFNSSDQAVVNVPWTDTNTTYSAATSSALGLMKLEDDTEQSVAANAVSSTASRTYGIQFNSSDQAVVNVPWTDTDTTYSCMTTSALGLGKLRYSQGATPAAEAQTTTANRTYGVTENGSCQLVVNVPWTDTTGAVTSVAASSNNDELGAIVSPTTGAVKVGIDIKGATNLGAVPASDDELLLYDNDGDVNKSITVENLLQSATNGAYATLNTSTTGVSQQSGPPAGTEGWVVDTGTILGASDALYVSCEVVRVSDGHTVITSVERSGDEITVNFVGSSISQGTYAVILNRVV